MATTVSNSLKTNVFPVNLGDLPVLYSIENYLDIGKIDVVQSKSSFICINIEKGESV